jgi:hypothetical protein
MAPKFDIALKYLRQFGLRPLALLALYKFGLMTGHYWRLTPVGDNRNLILDTRRPNIELSNIKYLFHLPSREQLASTLDEDGKAALLKEADEIVAGQFRMFGGEPVEIILTLPKPLQHWTDYETGKADLRPSTFDLKYLWEPARFGWAFILGRAYHLTQDNQYAESFWKYFESFSASNPANLGPHWMNGQEVAVRLLAFVWAAQVFETASASSAERRGLLLQSILQHATRIPPTLVYAQSQNNNHLVTEAAAIYTAGLLFKNQTWRALGWKWLNWSFQNQISGYGEYIQHSTNYQRVMLQAALWSDAIKDADWPMATAQSLERTAHYLFSMLDSASGRTPNLGSNDGALILPLSVTPFNDFRPTVQAAARSFLKTQMSAGAWDEMSLWLGLAPVQKTYGPEHYMTDHLRGQNSWAYLRASRFKSRLAHMDQLHLDLWWRGLNIAQDAGTYLYNAPAPWDNSLMATRVHNTVTVDGRDQMMRGGRFMVLDWVNAFSSSVIETDENILGSVQAYHKGYRGVRHERTVTVFRDERWVVVDRLIQQPLNLKNKTSHLYRVHWLLPDWKWEIAEIPNEIDGVGYDLRLLSPHGWLTVRVWVDYFFFATQEEKFSAGLARAGERIWGNAEVATVDGWVSTTYGKKEPALSFSMTGASQASTGFITEFIFPT